jgi:hypothetical protein
VIGRLLFTLSAEGPRSFRLADIIRDLVIKGGQLGELESCEVAAAGVVVQAKHAPREWFERLDKAIETEAIDYLDADRIVEILLQGK